MTHTVLLVDDDADVLHCLTRMLQRQPYQLYTARSGDEAVTLLKCRHVDVIVCDERMPGMSGSELLAWVARMAIMIRKALERKDSLDQDSQRRECTGPQAVDCQQCVKQCEALNHQLCRDVASPLHAIAASCRSLLEKNPDLFDAKAKCRIEETVETVGELQSLVEELLTQMRQRQSAALAAVPAGDGAATPA
jgi:CheY-like chemotaxis protein